MTTSKAEAVYDAMDDNSLVLKPKWWMRKTEPLKGKEDRKLKQHLAVDAHIPEAVAIGFAHFRKRRCCQMRMIRYKGKARSYYTDFEGRRYTRIFVCRHCGDYDYD